MSIRQSPDDSAVRQREPIPYAPAPNVVSVRGFRLLLGLTLVNTALLGGYVLGPQFFGLAKSQWSAYQQRKAVRQYEAAERAKRPAMIAAEQRAMAYRAEPGTLLYDDDPALRDASARSGSAGAGWPAVIPRPEEAGSLQSGWTGRFSAPILFMHERRASANSPARLVIVTCHLSQRMHLEGTGKTVLRPARTFETITIRPTTLDKTGGTELEPSHDISLPTGQSLRLYAGEPDAEDVSRFVIPYELGGERGLIHGQLLGNGVVHLSATGPLEQDLRSAMEAFGP